MQKTRMARTLLLKGGKEKKKKHVGKPKCEKSKSELGPPRVLWFVVLNVSPLASLIGHVTPDSVIIKTHLDCYKNLTSIPGSKLSSFQTI